MVVIAALFIAFAVIASVAVERNTTVQYITKRDAAREQLQRISYAIIEYSVFNASGGFNLYPCPARLDEAPTVATFGQASLNCFTPSDPAASPITTTGGIPVMGAQNSAVLRGMVPVQTLSQYGISVNDAFDPWNNRIMYVVNRNVTLGATPSQAGNPALTYILIDPASTAIPIPAPDFILISYGRDGVGAHKRTKADVTPTLACGAAATSTIYRLENCDVDATFFAMPTYTAGDANGTATSGAFNTPTNTYFDDILSWYRQ